MLGGRDTSTRHLGLPCLGHLPLQMLRQVAMQPLPAVLTLSRTRASCAEPNRTFPHCGRLPLPEADTEMELGVQDAY